MVWIELHQTVWTHRKTFEFAALLMLDETYAASHVIRLWTWALDNAPGGDLSSLSDRAIAYGAGWRGDAQQFVEALVAAGWLDAGRTIHDWDAYAGRLADRRERNAERMRNARAQHVRSTERTRVGLPNHTGPNSTRPDSYSGSKELEQEGVSSRVPAREAPAAAGGSAASRRIHTTKKSSGTANGRPAWMSDDDYAAAMAWEQGK